MEAITTTHSKINFNPSQLQAISHRGNPLLLVAGAGSGKTATLVGRVVDIIRAGTSPDRILMLTFTNKAAKSMIRRAEKALLEQGIEQNAYAEEKEIFAGTFHSVAYRFLHRFGTSSGFFRGNAVLGEYQTKRLWDKIYFAIPQDRRRWLFRFKLGGASELSAWHGKFMSGEYPSIGEFIQETPLAQKWEEIHPGIVARSFEQYKEFKHELKGMDFDDILILAVRMLEHQEILKQIRPRFEHILVDEYQDTSLLQARFLKLLAGNGQNLVVVGDPKQSIYHFLSARVTNITRFHESYPDATTLPLMENYRSNRHILDFANQILEGSQEVENLRLLPTKEDGEKPHIHKYGSDRMEARGLMRDIREALKTTPPGEIAVLSRLSSLTYRLERELIAAEIPYVKVGGLKLMNKSNIRQFIAFLEIAINRYNWLAWETILPMIPLIGAELTQTLIQDMRNFPEWTWDNPPPVSLGSGKRWKSFKAFWETMRKTEDVKALDTQDALDKAFKIFRDIYTRYWESTSEKDREKLELNESEEEEDNEESSSLEERLKEIHSYIVEMAASRGDFISNFLDKFKLDDSINQKPQGDQITLSTIHSAKGLEWDVVLVTGVEEGSLPVGGRSYGTPRANFRSAESDAEEVDVPNVTPWQEAPYIEEERRLFYVACTRAKKLLHVTYASQRRGMGRKDSRFLEKLKPAGALVGTVEGNYSIFTLEKMRTEEEMTNRFKDSE